MNTIIEKIRAEVERRKKALHSTVFNDEYNDLLSFLSTLEKECEKPTNIDFEQELYKHFGQIKDFTLGMQIGKYFYELGKQEKPTTAEGFEEEIKRFQKEVWDYDTTLSDVARHFARWGAVHIRKVTKNIGCSSEIPKDLESYAQMVENYYDVGEERGYLCVHRGEVKDAVIAGAKWQEEQDLKYISEIHRNGYNLCKEQLMKEAVEGVVSARFGTISIPHNIYERYDGQKVKLIIVKEDGK